MSAAQPKRVVVVGGTGNISTPVVHLLAGAGHEVTVFSRGETTRALPEGVRVLRGDRQDRAAFEALMQRERFDAAYDMISFTAEDAASALRAFDGVEHFVHTSTVCTIGGPLAELPANEDTPLRPVVPYGVDKARGDEVLLEAHRREGFPVTIFKPAHAWGVGFPVIRQLASRNPHWIDRLRAGKPLLIAGDGRQDWCLIHSEDVAQGYVGVLGQPSTFGESYIVTGPEPTTWLDYHRDVAAALGAPPPRLVPAPAAELVRLWPEGTGLLVAQTQWAQRFDVSKLMAAVPSFRPAITLADRVAEAAAWMEATGGLAPDDGREDEVIAALGLGVDDAVA
ncbi:MAG TPA: NAD-dependent epimerase/dehydratase family protein [Conexibacter sp.]|nr:NAD-dependent epimerase/dehydratase family protein [Conexibacter sp.]